MQEFFAFFLIAYKKEVLSRETNRREERKKEKKRERVKIELRRLDCSFIFSLVQKGKVFVLWRIYSFELRERERERETIFFSFYNIVKQIVYFSFIIWLNNKKKKKFWQIFFCFHLFDFFCSLSYFILKCYKLLF